MGVRGELPVRQRDVVARAERAPKNHPSVGELAVARKCPVCDGSASRDFLRVRAERLRRDRPTPSGEYRYQRCGRCDATFLAELPPAGDLQLYYESDAYHFRPLPGSRSGGEARGLVWARDLHLALSRPLPPGQPGALLDFGCGPGDYLACARRRGWDAIGVEWSHESGAEARARGFRVLTEGEIAALPDASFRAISMIHSLEHHPRPLEVVTQLARVLAPDGSLLVELPMLDCFEFALFGRHYSMIQAPLHLQFLSDRTMAFVAERTGLVLTEVRNNLWSPVHFVWSVLNWIEERSGLSISRSAKNVASAVLFPLMLPLAWLATLGGHPASIRQYVLRRRS